MVPKLTSRLLTLLQIITFQKSVLGFLANPLQSSDDYNQFSDNTDDDLLQCASAKSQYGVALRGGTKAGEYVKLGTMHSISQCQLECCRKNNCKLAILLTSPKTGSKTCFQINCYDPKSYDCQPVFSNSKFSPILFEKPGKIYFLKIHDPVREP